MPERLRIRNAYAAILVHDMTYPGIIDGECMIVIACPVTAIEFAYEARQWRQILQMMNMLEIRNKLTGIRMYR